MVVAAGPLELAVTIGLVDPPSSRLWAHLLLYVHRAALNDTLVWTLVHACFNLLGTDLKLFLEAPLL